MTTHEHEITAPVDLCLPDSPSLNPDALGWSRVPLHRANLWGEQGRNKRWDYWAVLAGDLTLSIVYSNIDHFGLVDVFWADLATGESGTAATLAEPRAVVLPERCGTTPLHFDRDGIRVGLVDDAGGTRLQAAWTDADGRSADFDVYVELPPRHESLNVVIPWDDSTFNFTSKHQARPAHGVAHVGGREWVIGDDAWGVLDVGRGRWPHVIHWNWGGGAGRSRATGSDP
ncbi:MAG TPA: DUF2804 family protein, partial [Ilumatobacteraceae bacterium]|nr:DUF2804 family protein [Ilumatobacteraceae bacterium]